MRIINVIGGLGNQMFQCALAVALREKFPDEIVKLDISHFNGYGLHNGFEVTEVFEKYPIAIASKADCKKMTTYIPNYKWSRLCRRLFPKRKTEYLQSYKKSYLYDDAVFAQSGDCYFEGYWMSPKYFEFCRNEIIEAFEFAPFNTEQNKHFAELLGADHSVSIHIRRGDYINAPNLKDICTLDYYRKSITEAKKHIPQPTFCMFFNDQEWCVENLKDVLGNAEMHFVTNNKGRESYRDMQLMSLARCNILANSSFSWWGAFLNRRQDQIVYVPSRWVNNLDDRDAYVEDWHKIEI